MTWIRTPSFRFLYDLSAVYTGALSESEFDSMWSFLARRQHDPSIYIYWHRGDRLPQYRVGVEAGPGERLGLWRKLSFAW